MISAKEAQALAQAHVGLEAGVLLLDGPPDGLYLSGSESSFYFAVGRPHALRVGSDEIAIVERTTGTVTIVGVGE